ncbi:putative MOB kinase activator 2 isoform X1 [Apostichopus japonicus]|uniref:Putative MOB kinase activator 2 isoform X1 n=1 Tax=Stichopus japonicus TaxID=307972 RepID=A0A2G8KIP1_STIJA|nr:putative MOB kinase activator 2 isoform X1 [Apostichopus japonicus]
MKSKRRTSKKDKKTPSPSEEPRPYLHPEYSKAKVIDLDIREIVRLPTGFEHDEWVGSTTLSFFNNINLLYGVLVHDYCNNESCPVMSAPNNVQYNWQDERGKKAKCTAPQYIEYAMTYSERQFKDETVFPTKYGQTFPSDFRSIIQRINRYFFHLLAHIYHSHFLHLTEHDLHRHLNSIFCHFMHFSVEFDLIDTKDTAVLEDLIEIMQLNCQEGSTASAAATDTDSSISGAVDPKRGSSPEQ